MYFGVNQQHQILPFLIAKQAWYDFNLFSWYKEHTKLSAIRQSSVPYKIKLWFEACLETTHNEVLCDQLCNHAIRVQHCRECICLHNQVLIRQVMWLYIVIITTVHSWSSASFIWCWPLWEQWVQSGGQFDLVVLGWLLLADGPNMVTHDDGQVPWTVLV